MRERELPPWCAWDTDKERIYYRFLIYIAIFMNIQGTLHASERERSRRDAISTTHETRTRRGLDFTSYKVLIIMFMADLCYIFIYVIKWFLKSPVCFRNHTKYENNFNWNMPTVFHMMKKSIFRFLKKKHLKTIWPSQITVNIGHCMSMKLLVICSAFSM